MLEVSKPLITPAFVPMLPVMVEEVTLLTAPALVKITNPEAEPKLGKHCADDEVRIPKKRT